jgi:hypothetical protein
MELSDDDQTDSLDEINARINIGNNCKNKYKLKKLDYEVY